MKHPNLSTAALALGLLGFAAATQASLITSSANLPPDGVYLSLDIHQTYGGPALEFLLSLPEHKPFVGTAHTKAGGNGAAGTPADEIEDFDSSLTGLGEVKQNAISLGTFPLTANGPVQTIVFNKIGNTTGTFETEMLSMMLSGVSPFGPFMIRESPTLASTGQVSIQDIGGGLYQIDSFFDVFTELSIDGGATWAPSNNGPGHVTLFGLNPIPEPSTWAAAGALALMAGMAWCRGKR